MTASRSRGFAREPPANSPDYTLRHRVEILQILDRLRNERTLTTMEFRDGHAIVSMVLDVRPTATRSYSTSRAIARRTTRCSRRRRSTSLTELDHIQIAFETGTPLQGRSPTARRVSGPAGRDHAPCSAASGSAPNADAAAGPMHRPGR